MTVRWGMLSTAGIGRVVALGAAMHLSCFDDVPPRVGTRATST